MFRDDDDSYDSFEDCFGFKQKDMFRGHPKCSSCGRHSFPGCLYDGICERCEELQELRMMNEPPDDDSEEDDDIPLSTLRARAESLKKEKKNLTTTKTSPTAKMTVGKMPTHHVNKVTPNAKPPVVIRVPQTTKPGITVTNPYAKNKKSSIPVFKANAKTKSKPGKGKFVASNQLYVVTKVQQLTTPRRRQVLKPQSGAFVAIMKAKQAKKQVVGKPPPSTLIAKAVRTTNAAQQAAKQRNKYNISNRKLLDFAAMQKGK